MLSFISDTQAVFPTKQAHTVTLDDDPLVSTLIQQILGINTIAFENITHLQQSSLELNPVGVFVDIHLANGECGLEILPTLRERWPMSPVIVMTSDPDESMVGHALALGANDFILKPLRHGELRARYLARQLEMELLRHQTLLTFGDVTLNTQYKSLIGPKGSCFLSPREVDILGFLIKTNGVRIDKSTLKATIWGNISVGDNALDRKLFDVRKSIKSVSDAVKLRSIYRHGIELVSKSATTEALPIDLPRLN